MAAKKRRLPATQDLPLPVGGGMFTSGDFAKIPPNCSPKIKNMFVRPGPRVEKRPGWDRETTLPAGNDFWTRLLPYRGDAITRLMAIGAGPGGTRTDAGYDGLWTATPSTETTDAAILGGILYGSNFASTPRIWSWDGVTVTANAAQSNVAGRSITSFNNRLFAGYLREKPTNILTTAAYKFEDNTVWTLAGGPPTIAVATNLRKLTIVGATDTLKTTAAIYTAGATDEYLTVQLPFRAYDAAVDMPFTVTLEDAAGANVYAAAYPFVVNRSAQPDWQTFLLQGRVPAGVAIYLKYAPGTPLLTAVAGSVDVADNTTAHVVFAATGRRVYSYNGTGAVRDYPSRFGWCEVNDVTQWRATSYYDCNEVPGYINAIRPLGGQLHVFKADAIWVFNPLDNPSLPIQFTRRHENVGCVAPAAVTTYKNALYFIGRTEVWRLAQDGEPEPLAGAGMRELMFDGFDAEPVDDPRFPCIAVSETARELYVHVRRGKIDVLNLETHAWSHLTITGADDAELELTDMVCLHNSANGDAELWCALADTANIVKLTALAVSDNITGVARAVTAEYTFRPLQTQPLSTFLIESLDIDHAITADQSTSTTSFELSYDGGATFPNSNTVIVSPLAGADYQPMTVPLWESQDRILVNLKHTGAAGPRAFNLSGARAKVQTLGERIQRNNPTPGTNTL